MDRKSAIRTDRGKDGRTNGAYRTSKSRRSGKVLDHQRLPIHCASSRSSLTISSHPPRFAGLVSTEPEVARWTLFKCERAAGPARATSALVAAVRDFCRKVAAPQPARPACGNTRLPVANRRTSTASLRRPAEWFLPTRGSRQPICQASRRRVGSRAPRRPGEESRSTPKGDWRHLRRREEGRLLCPRFHRLRPLVAILSDYDHFYSRPGSQGKAKNLRPVGPSV